MEEALLVERDEKWKVTWRALAEELKKVSYIAVPMVVVSVSHYLLQVVSVMMAGHLSELSLSGVAIANSFTAVTGFSLVVKFSNFYLFISLFRSVHFAVSSLEFEFFYNKKLL
ncbi:MATE efflux family protein DTX1 [Morus notabilis]|uniref:MATE efflux family protein DTX1 n=1 Tax=Morus notabilis TaxID=981085 RepID=W9S106_9ROSA|nr:MATE efflux family protein DTX1 [Morus notabilis]